MCPRRLLPFSVTRGLEYSTETVAGPICWVTVACWLSPLGGRDSLSARAMLENNAHVQRKVLFMASGTTPYASHRINPRIPNGTDGRQNRRDRVEPARTGPPGGWPFSGTAQQISEAFPWQTEPRFLIRDRDRVYGPTFKDRVESLGLEEVLTAPRSPWQNAFAERVIGSIRRECLDHE